MSGRDDVLAFLAHVSDSMRDELLLCDLAITCPQPFEEDFVPEIYTRQHLCSQV